VSVHFRALLWAVLPGLILAGAAAAEPFNYYLDANNLETSSLVRMDLETRAQEVVGDTLENLLALQFDAQGRLWAVSSDALFRLSPTTGRATQVGDLGDLTLPSNPDLAISPSGELWLATSDSGGVTLYTVSLSTGEATLNTQLPDPSSGITFVGDKLILLSGSNLLEFDPATGATMLLTPAVSGGGGFFGAMDSSGQTLYYQWINLVSILPITLVSLDLETGDSSNVAREYALYHNVQSLAICDNTGLCRGRVTDVPAADAVGLGVLAALLAVAGIAFQRRRASS
ncbi:MAG: hypothetical protein AAFY88_18885, partial [Acidobacteriota bacterium]